MSGNSWRQKIRVVSIIQALCGLQCMIQPSVIQLEVKVEHRQVIIVLHVFNSYLLSVLRGSSLCFIRHHTMKMCGGVKVELHVFLPNVAVVYC
jgi:hypothetical protein